MTALPPDEKNPANDGDSHRSRTFVTGAAGHVGANLVRRLLALHRPVRVLLRPEDDNAAIEGLNVEVAHGDLRDFETLRRVMAGCGNVYHCAAKLSTIEGDSRHRREVFECNVIGTRNLLRAARDCGARRVVVTGSFSAVGYDLDDPASPSDESMPFYPMERTMPYERSKVLVEHECLKAVAEGQDVVIATCCAVVGGNDFLPSRLGRTLRDYVNGKLHAYVAGGFEFVAARDIVAGHLLCMEKGRRGHRYIFGTEFLTIDRILELFHEVSGIRPPRRRVPVRLMLAFAEAASFYLSRFHPDFPQRFTPGAIRLLAKNRHADTTKARRELGFRPSSIREAVHEAYAFHYARGALTNRSARPPRTGMGLELERAERTGVVPIATADGPLA